MYGVRCAVLVRMIISSESRHLLTIPGAARPRLFIDCTTNDLKEEMSLDYFTALHTVHVRAISHPWRNVLTLHPHAADYQSLAAATFK